MGNGAGLFSDGETYQRLRGRSNRAVGELFLDWLSLPKGLKWLDVGCGSGAFTELVLERCAPSYISAIDPAEGQVRHARNRPELTQVAFRVGEAEALPYGDHEFDVAAMALVMTFVSNPTKAVTEMMRVVRPGGIVGTFAWDFVGKGYTQQPLRDAIEAMGVAVPLSPRHANSRLEDLQRFFAQAGLDLISKRGIEIQVSYPSFDDYWAAETLLSNFVVQPLQKMTEMQVKQVKSYLQQRLPRDGEGHIAYPARVNAIKGQVPV